MYMKRQSVPKNWPIKRKGTKYVVVTNFGRKNGVPILIVLRDMLNLARNRKEVKRVLREEKILINSKKIIDDKNAVMLFDVVSIVPSNEHYRLDLSDKGKFVLEKIKNSEKDEKISKIVNKTTLKKGKVQINLSDGRNFISDTKCKVNDSVLIDLKSKKIKKILNLSEGKGVIVFAGKHAGKKAKIENLNLEEKTAQIKDKNSKVNVLIKQMMVVN